MLAPPLPVSHSGTRSKVQVPRNCGRGVAVEKTGNRIIGAAYCGCITSSTTTLLPFSTLMTL